MRTIIHTLLCLEMKADEQAWLTKWPHYHAACYGAGVHHDPGVWRYPDGSGQPPSDDPCTCTDSGVCPRCGLSLYDDSPWPLVALRLQTWANTANDILRRHYKMNEYKFVDPVLGDWNTRVVLFANQWTMFYYKPMLDVAIFFQSLAPDIDQHLCDGLPCIHCGWNWGENDDDVLPQPYCDCDYGMRDW